MRTTKTPTITLRSPRTLRMPPRAETRARLPDVAEKLRGMQAPAVIIVQDPALVARVAKLEAALAKTGDVARDRAQREERVKVVTIRVVDRRASWEAKMGMRQKQPLVCLTSQRIVTADVWTQPQGDE